MIACTYGALGWAEQRLASGIAALLSATPPIWLTAIEWRRGGRPTTATIAGVVLGLAGVAMLVGGTPASQVDVPAALVLLAGTVAWTAGTLYGRLPRLPVTVALGAGMPLVTGGAMLLAASALAGEAAPRDIVAVPHAALWSLAYLIVFGSLVAFSAYAWLLRVAPASRVATHAYVNPLIAVALGWSVAGEPVTATTGIAAGVIAASVAVIVRGSRRSLARGSGFGDWAIGICGSERDQNATAERGADPPDPRDLLRPARLVRLARPVAEGA